MRVLALETSTLLGSVAIIEDKKVVAEAASLRQNSHSEIINSYVDDCLKKNNLTLADIDVFAAGQGPGSFTGIRVAVNAAKSYSFCYNKPIISLDSLYLLAASVQDKSYPVLAMINAYKNMVYYGLFNVAGEFPEYIQGPGVIPVQQLAKIVKQEVLVIGDGFAAYKDYLPKEISPLLRHKSEVVDYPQAKTLGLHAERLISLGQTFDWKSLIPLYIRASEAEENKRGIVFIPL